MGKLSAEDQAHLERLLAARDAPDDEGGEIWVKDGDREYRLSGGHASRAYAQLFGDQAASSSPTKTAKKAAKKAAPEPVDDEDQDDEDDEPDDEPDPPTGARPTGRALRALGFGSPAPPKAAAA